MGVLWPEWLPDEPCELVESCPLLVKACSPDTDEEEEGRFVSLGMGLEASESASSRAVASTSLSPSERLVLDGPSWLICPSSRMETRSHSVVRFLICLASCSTRCSLAVRSFVSRFCRVLLMKDEDFLPVCVLILMSSFLSACISLK